MIDAETFPSFVRAFPEAALEFDGLRGWRLSGDDGVVMFMAANKDVEVPTHHHDEQWGIVLAGEMELTIGEESRTYRVGDTHFIPAGVDHAANIRAGWQGIYVFPKPHS